MAKSKQLTIQDLQGFVLENRIAGEHGRGISKSLDSHFNPVDGNVKYKVVSHGEEVFSSSNLQEAIDSYNAQGEKEYLVKWSLNDK